MRSSQSHMKNLCHPYVALALKSRRNSSAITRIEPNQIAGACADDAGCNGAGSRTFSNLRADWLSEYEKAHLHRRSNVVEREVRWPRMAGAKRRAPGGFKEQGVH